MQKGYHHRMKTIHALLLFLAIAPITLAGETTLVLDAIEQVETGGQKDPAHAVGDHGAAHGWLQMHRPVYVDVVRFKPALGAHTYAEVCASRSLSRIFAEEYFNRYKCTTDESRARIWNGGPTWASRPASVTATAAYWKRVQSFMRKAADEKAH